MPVELDPFPGEGEDEGGEKGALGGVPSTDKIGGIAIQRADRGWGRYEAVDKRRAPYTEKDVLTPRNWTADQRADLQARLVGAGLLDPNKAVAGVWNSASMDAYRKLLKNSNVMGYKAGTLLEAAMQNPSLVGVDPSAGSDRQEPPALVYELPNEDDLRRVFAKTGRDIVGHKLDPTTIDRMVTSYIAQERGRQEAAYGTGMTARDGGAVGTTSEGEAQAGFAEEYVRDIFPDEAESMEMAQAGEEFFSLIRSSGRGD